MSNASQSDHPPGSRHRNNKRGEKRYWIGVDGAGGIYIRSWDGMEFVALSRRQFIAIIQAVASVDQHMLNDLCDCKTGQLTAVRQEDRLTWCVDPDPKTEDTVK